MEYIDAYRNLRAKLNNEEFFEDLSSWRIGKIHRDCRIVFGTLYDKTGNILSRDGGCMDEYIPYFVNQSVGYLGDDFSGTMFVKLGYNNDFLEIHYEC